MIWKTVVLQIKHSVSDDEASSIHVTRSIEFCCGTDQIGLPVFYCDAQAYEYPEIN